MRVSDVLGTCVHDSAGEVVGWVTDVRLVRDGPVLGTFGPAYRVEGLIVSHRHRGGYFGYETSRLSRPTVVNWLFARLHRGTVFAPWDAIESIEDDDVILRRTAGELAPPPPLEG
jgi:sporulation protein YlmC with PRC-barrel domain